MGKVCRDTCKWLGYDYTQDFEGNLTGEEGYKCLLYSKSLDSVPNRCKECIESAKSKKYNV